ncbi:30S ribosome-binding factor RbfA [Pasteuria penetrans]|uniref:30S ribosome-binding factor RbfA n=1 Tax=Pasteuria penetrans TaxID=86005 RepID=UPI000FA8C8E0|nr:30S ribosome-binding factor RbfA [Pasteuria penetrans]
MAAQVRGQRLGELIKKELGHLLHRSVKDPRIGFVTVTAVEMSGDLQIAKVYVSVMGSAEKQAEALAGLVKAKGFLRTEVGRRLSVRYTPELEFVLDVSLSYSEHIGTLLADIESTSPSSMASKEES